LAGKVAVEACDGVRGAYKPAEEQIEATSGPHTCRIGGERAEKRNREAMAGDGSRFIPDRRAVNAAYGCLAVHGIGG